MQEIICTSQAELDAVSADFEGRVIVKFGKMLAKRMTKNEA